MSQYSSMPPPGAYVPPNQGTPAQQQHGLQQPQSPALYHPATSNHGAPGQPQKAGGAFGQMMNQAVTTGKPMLNKLSKTISSKLGSKPLASGPPQQQQHNYQGHQGHHGQQSQPQGHHQQPSQTFTPQPQQQQQWGQAHQQQPPQARHSYVPPQQSPHQHSNYPTPASGHSGQSNYFPQQPNQAPNSLPQTPQQPPNVPGYSATQFGQVGSAMEQQMQAQQEQSRHSQYMQGQGQSPFQHDQQLQGQYAGQQTGVVGGIQNSVQSGRVQSPHMGSVPPEKPAQSAQSQWGYPSPGPEQLPSPAPQQQPTNPTGNTQPYHATPSPSVQQNQQHQQWNPMPSVSPQGQAASPFSLASISPPPPQQTSIPPQLPSNKSTESPKPAPQSAVPHSAPTEFVAELPADMHNLSIMESKPQGSDQSTHASQYQAYHLQGRQTASPSSGFTIPRRSVSASTSPLADPWRFANPLTELPTREFYILADLLFDALDRRFEPKNTGLLEASKVLNSWVNLTEDASHLFSYKSYSAFAKLWSLEGIPHILVPCEPTLRPNWNFSQHSHAHDVKVIAEPPTPMSTYATYMPALNRAGWYKFFFLEIMHAPEHIGDLVPALCADTYKPGVLNHPDLNRRDKAEIPALQARAAAIQSTAIARVCDEIKSAMAADPDAHNHPGAGSSQPSEPYHRETWQ